jgi:hypothetical protein
MSARRVYAVILSNPSKGPKRHRDPQDHKDHKDNTMKHRKSSARRHSRSNPDMSAMRRTAGVAAKIALGAVAGAAGVRALAGVTMSPRNMTIAIAAGGAVLGGGLMVSGKAPNVGAGLLASGAAFTAQRVYDLHGVGAYIDSMRAPSLPGGQRPPGGQTNGGGGIAGLPSGYVVSQYMPGSRNSAGFTVVDPAQRTAVTR